MKNLMLVTTAFIVSIVSILCTQSEALPPPYFYGTNPDTGACEEGELVGACGGRSNVRCTVAIDDYEVPAFDGIIGTVCAKPSYRPGW